MSLYLLESQEQHKTAVTQAREADALRLQAEAATKAHEELNLKHEEVCTALTQKILEVANTIPHNP